MVAKAATDADSQGNNALAEHHEFTINELINHT